MTTPRAFTLLEAVIALVILSSVITAVVTLRSGGIDARERIQRVLAEQRAADHVMRLANEGLLGEPEPIEANRPESSDAAGTAPPLRWTGTAFGVDYECVRTFVRLERPEVPPPPSAGPQETSPNTARNANSTAARDADREPGTIVVARFEVRCGSLVIHRHVLPER